VAATKVTVAAARSVGNSKGISTLGDDDGDEDPRVRADIKGVR